MATVGVHAAKSQLSKLIAQAEAGEDVIITRDGRPVARVIPYVERPMRRAFGLYKGQFPIDERFFEPLPEDELKAWHSD